jgi:hypothetical protein
VILNTAGGWRLIAREVDGSVMIFRYAIFWFGLLILAVLNGTARDLLYRDLIGEFRAQQISCATGAALFFIFTWLANRRWPIGRASTAIGIGAIWLVMTVCFEFFMVVVLVGKPISTAIDQYDLIHGNLWPLVLLAVFLIPFAVWKLDPRRTSS